MEFLEFIVDMICEVVWTALLEGDIGTFFTQNEDKD